MRYTENLHSDKPSYEEILPSIIKKYELDEIMPSLYAAIQELKELGYTVSVEQLLKDVL